MSTTNTTTTNPLRPPVRTFSGVRIFDCRLPDEEPTPRAPWGEGLYGAERACYALGLLRGWSERDMLYTLGIQTSADLRSSPDEYRRLVRQAVRSFKEQLDAFAGALAEQVPEDEEHSYGLYQPVAIAVANFGVTIIADIRARALVRTDCAVG